MLSYLNMNASFLRKHVSKLIGGLIWFLYRVELYVIGLGILAYNMYNFRCTYVLFLGQMFIMHVF